MFAFGRIRVLPARISIVKARSAKAISLPVFWHRRDLHPRQASPSIAPA
jgi:hypothetical protein